MHPHSSLPSPVSIMQQPIPNNFAGVLGPLLKVDKIANDMAPLPISGCRNKKHRLIVKKGCIINVMRNLFLATVSKATAIHD